MSKLAKAKPATKTKKPDSKKNTGAATNTTTPVILPTYMKMGSASSDHKQSRPHPVFVPSSDELLSAHQQSLDASLLKSRPNAADSILAANYGASGEVQWLDVSASIAGENGALQMKDTFIFDPTAAPEDVMLTHDELDLPPEFGRTDPYPIQFYFKREVSYADKKGRILSMEYVVTMGFTVETWRKEAGILLDTSSNNQWHRLRYMQADEASATLLIDGQGLTGQSYIAHGFADGFAMVFDQLGLSLNTGLMDLKELDITMLARPETGAGYQFGKLHAWLDHVDHERWKKAHPDKPWYEDVGDFMVGAGKSVYNNTIGAVYQAGLQLSDMQRLWLAVVLKKTGIADYNPSMWSDMGKAAEQGATTTDLLVGMVEGTVLAPYRFVKAVERGDAGAAGEALGDTVFAIEGARGTIKSAPGMLRTARQGFGKLRTAIPSLKAGLRDFHAGLRGKGDAVLQDVANINSGQYRHSMADSGSPRGPYTPPDVYGPITPERARLDTVHYNWIDQMHQATLGNAPEPPAWKGRKPTLDKQGRWTGWDPVEAYAAYRAAIESNKGIFEVIIARDRISGQYEVMLGDRRGVSPSANLDGQLWDTVMHYHPNLEGAKRYTLPAGTDMSTAAMAAANGPLADGRPHIEFVESILNGKTTRVAIVMGGKDGLGRIDMSAGVLGETKSTSMPFNSQYQKFWNKQDGGKPIESLPDEKLWVPEDSQAHRNLLLKTAEELGHKDAAEIIKSKAPEESGSQITAKTQSGQVLDAVAPPQKLSQRELIKLAPPGSPYHSLKEFGLPPRFANPIGDDEVADLGSMRIVKSTDELRELMKKSRLAGGFYSNGQPLDPTRDLGGSAYWLVIQGKKGELWLVPHYLLEKKPNN